MVTVPQHAHWAGDAGSWSLAPEFEHVVERLRVSYPELDSTEIRLAVQDAALGLEGARLQQFVPLLVEKIAREECRHLYRRRQLTADPPRRPR